MDDAGRAADAGREAELAARLAVLEERLAELERREHGAGARPGARELESMESLVLGLLPSDVRGHMRAARKEQLLAVRSLVDHWIERVDRTPPERRRRESIPLEDA
jgi:hypothetical protein